MAKTKKVIDEDAADAAEAIRLAAQADKDAQVASGEGMTGPIPVVRRARGNAPETFVSVTITKHGDGKVSTGIHVAGEGDIMAERGEKLVVTKSTGLALEKRAFAEIDESADAAAATQPVE